MVLTKIIAEISECADIAWNRCNGARIGRPDVPKNSGQSRITSSSPEVPNPVLFVCKIKLNQSIDLIEKKVWSTQEDNEIKKAL